MSHNLLSARWGPRKANGAWIRTSENQELCWCKSQSEGRRLVSQLERSGREGEFFPSSAFLFYPGPQQIGWGPPTWGEQSALFRNFMWKQPPIHIQKRCSPHVWASCDPEKWHIKFIIEVYQGLFFSQHPLVCQCSWPACKAGIPRATEQLVEQVCGRTLKALFHMWRRSLWAYLT